MADLLAANVTTISAYRIGGTSSKSRLRKRIRYTNTTAGTAANKLLASAMGLRVIEECSGVFFDAATKAVYPAVPSADGSYVVLTNPNQVTDANRTDLFDLATGASNAYLSVTGYD